MKTETKHWGYFVGASQSRFWKHFLNLVGNTHDFLVLEKRPAPSLNEWDDSMFEGITSPNTHLATGAQESGNMGAQGAIWKG